MNTMRWMVGSGLLLSLSWVSKAQQLPQPAHTTAQDSLKQVKPVLNFKPGPVAGKDYYYQSLGLACKLEFKMEKATKVPLRLRLGSLQQTDYMEQKPNVQKPER